MYKITSILALLFISISLNSQNIQINPESISASIDGISDYKIITDGNSTTRYISSLNGKIFYNTNNLGWEEFQISNFDIGQINAFEVTDEGVVYIATQEQGVIYGVGPEMNVYDKNMDALVINRYWDVLYDDEDALWILDSRGRLLKLKNGVWRNFTEEPMGTLDALEFLHFDTYGDVWAHGEDINDEHISDTEFNRYYFVLVYGGSIVNSVSQDQEQKFWLSTKKGPIVHVKGESTDDDRAKEITDNRGTTHIINNNNELVWLSLIGGGIMIWDDINKTRMVFETTDYPELPENVKGMWLNDDNSVSIIALDSPDIITLSLQPVATDQLDREAFKIYPNPVSNIISWENDFEIRSISILDLTGRLIKSSKESINQMDVSDLDQGVYFLELNGSTGIKSIKTFVKGR